jgi:hypothetical protein
MNYINGLSFEDKPDYQHCISLFEKNLALENSNALNSSYDWMKVLKLQPIPSLPIQKLGDPSNLSQLQASAHQVSDRSEGPALDALVTNDTDISWTLQRQILQRKHETITEKIIAEHNAVVDQLKHDNATLSKNVEEMKCYIEQIEIESAREKTQLEESYQIQIEDLKIQFDLQLEDIRSEAEEMESNHVLASQRREQKLTERMEKSITEERSKVIELQMELDKLCRELTDIRTVSVEAARWQDTNSAANISRHIEQHSSSDMPSDVADDDQLETGHY